MQCDLPTLRYAALVQPEICRWHCQLQRRCIHDLKGALLFDHLQRECQLMIRSRRGCDISLLREPVWVSNNVVHVVTELVYVMEHSALRCSYAQYISRGAGGETLLPTPRA